MVHMFSPDFMYCTTMTCREIPNQPLTSEMRRLESGQMHEAAEHQTPKHSKTILIYMKSRSSKNGTRVKEPNSQPKTDEEPHKRQTEAQQA